MNAILPLDRRGFLAAAAAAAGGLVLSVSLPLTGRAGAAEAGGAVVNAWLAIAPDGTVTAMVASAEMGQGIATSLPMLIAEELEADWADVRFALAPADEAFNNPFFNMQGTGGSSSIRGFFEPLRRAGAQAREMLRAAAAEAWGVPVAECTAALGRIRHAPTGRSEGYGALAAAAGRRTPPDEVALKDPADWRIIGRPVARLDLPAKVDGSAVFGIDVKLPGMLVGTVAACPVFGGRLLAVDEAPALAVRGVRQVVRLDDAVIVLADGYWPARKGLDALSPAWEEGPNAGNSSAAISERLRAALDDEGAVALAEGEAGAGIDQAADIVEALYEVPLLAHATMEPMTATANVSADGAEIWAPTQFPGPTHHVTAQILGLAPDKVRVNTTLLGGGFGRKAELDFVLQAVAASRAAGAPVKLVWSREEDIRHDFYRPPVAARLRAGLDEERRPVALAVRIASPSIMTRVFPQFVKDGIDPTSVEGVVEMPYGIPAREVRYALTDVGVPVGFWRSVGNSQNAFFVESFIDELAAEAGADPVAFRLSLLESHPRHRAVLERAAALGGWGVPPAAGRARGVALHESFGSIVAEVAEIAIDGSSLKVHKIACVIDCGVVVNPDTVVAQMKGGIVYGLTAALFGRITIEKGRVVEGNFDTYPMLRMAEAPAIEVEILASGGAVGGVGEPSTPPVAPALANAIFAATGTRIRTLPIAAHGFTAA